MTARSSALVLGAALLVAAGQAVGAEPSGVSWSPSRLFGVAPLAVFFDATATVSRPGSRAFHDLEYRWDFGDAAGSPVGGTSWSTGSRAGESSRNSATGAVAAHIYESPGSFTVTLTVDGVSSTRVITVLDPENTFAGPGTICFAVSGSFESCPPGARHVLTDDFAFAINTYQGARRRLLFRRGDTFFSRHAARITAGGPGSVAAFGAGPARPLIRLKGAHPVILLSSASTPGIADWRIADLAFDGGLERAGAAAGVVGDGGVDQVTLLRLELRDLRNPLLFAPNVLNGHNRRGHGGHRVYDQLAIADSSIHRIVGGRGSNGGFIAAKRFAFVGNIIHDATDAEHNLRTPYVGKGVLSNNTLSMPAARKHVIQMHAPCHAGTGCNVLPALYDGMPLTEHVVISDNKFIGGGAGAGWTVYVGAQNDTSDERLRDIVYERNWHVAGSGTRTGLSFDASEMTIRNNIFDMTGGAGGYSCLLFSKRGPIAVSDAVRIYNNTCFSNDRGGDLVLLSHQVDPSLPGAVVSVVNNLVYGPGAARAALVRGAGAAKVSASHNTTDSQIRAAAPGWVVASPRRPADFALGAASVYLDAGKALPVSSDFLLQVRPRGAAIDVGALER